MTEQLSFIGDRDVWIDFVATVKKQRSEVWIVLAPFLKHYMKTHRENKQ